MSDTRRGGRARLKASDSKSDRGVSPSGVQILSPPPNLLLTAATFAERCRSGLTGATGNRVYGKTVPGVQIPPSPPVRVKGGSGGAVSAPPHLGGGAHGWGGG